jgi:single-stranded-DNA-specific exonuclease
LTLTVVEEIEKLEPHGIGNPRPLLLASDVQVEGQPRPVGDQKKHLQLRLRQGGVVLKAIAWGLAEKGKALTPGKRCSVVFHPSINEWQSRRNVQLEIKDFELDGDVP